MLTWHFSSHSYAYEMFLGLGELTGAGLLIFRRTTTVGACLLLAILGNVAFLNYSHHIPVKFQSSCYVIMVCYLLALDFRRLAFVFFENRESGIDFISRQPAVPAKNPGVVIPLKLGFAAFALANAFAYILILDSKPSAVCGAWSVSQILESGTGTSTDDSMLWKKIFFERENAGTFSGSVKDSNGSKTNF